MQRNQSRKRKADDALSPSLPTSPAAAPAWENGLLQNENIVDLDMPASNDWEIDEFVCPITLVEMEDPVIAADDHTYERAAISEWFLQRSMISPKTGLPFSNTNVVPNFALQQAIKAYSAELNNIRKTVQEFKDARAAFEVDQKKLEQQQKMHANPEHEQLLKQIAESIAAETQQYACYQTEQNKTRLKIQSIHNQIVDAFLGPATTEIKIPRLRYSLMHNNTLACITAVSNALEEAQRYQALLNGEKEAVEGTSDKRLKLNEAGSFQTVEDLPAKLMLLAQRQELVKSKILHHLRSLPVIVPPKAVPLPMQYKDRQFYEINVPGNGNCGFTALETSRAEVVELLLAKKDDVTYRDRLAVEIVTAMREEILRPNLNNKTASLNTAYTFSLFKDIDGLQEAVRRDVTLINDLLARDVPRFRRKSSTELIEYLLAREIVLSPDLARWHNLELEVQKASSSLELYVRYVQQELGGRGWLGCKSAMLFTECKNYAIYIYRRESPTSRNLILVERNHPPTSERMLSLLYTQQFTHFNPLYLRQQPQGPTEKKNSVADMKLLLKEADSLPVAFMCSLTGKTMEFPVMAANGFLYEEKAWKEKYPDQSNPSSLRPNHTLRNAITSYKGKMQQAKQWQKALRDIQQTHKQVSAQLLDIKQQESLNSLKHRAALINKLNQDKQNNLQKEMFSLQTCLKKAENINTELTALAAKKQPLLIDTECKVILQTLREDCIAQANIKIEHSVNRIKFRLLRRTIQKQHLVKYHQAKKMKAPDHSAREKLCERLNTFFRVNRSLNLQQQTLIVCQSEQRYKISALIQKQNNLILQDVNTGPIPPQDDPATILFKCGCDLYHAGRWSEAAMNFESCLRMKPDKTQALKYLGMANIHRTFYHNAISYFSQYLSVERRDAFVFEQRGWAYQKEHLMKEALQDYQTSIQIEQNNPLVLSKCGYILNTMERYPEALEQVNKSLSIKPDLAPALLTRGEIYYAQGQFTLALQDLMQITEKSATTLPIIDQLRASRLKSQLLETLARRPAVMRR